jgi:CRISPR-associated protein Csx17
MEGDSLINRWDYVLMLEGTVLLGGSVCRKLGVSQAARAAFPFTVTSLAAGESMLAQKEVRESRGEIWLPLWHQPAGVSEIQYIFTEGRSELRGHQSKTSTDFARSIAGLGVDRGILSFSRQGFLKRNGLAFIATPLGRFDVHGQEKVRLLFEIDVWLDHFRYACKIGQKGEAPARLAISLRHIDEAIFAYCRYGGHVQFQKILIALGRAERELMRDGQWAVKNAVRPLFGLSSDWVAAANDGSVEFELALSLSEIRGIGDIGSLRTNLEAARFGRRKDGLLYGDWADKDRSVVWNAAALSVNLANVLSRRLLDARRLNSEHLPLRSTRTASLEAISMFAAGLTDDQSLEDLLWGLMLVGGREADDVIPGLKMRRWPDAPPLSRLYAFLKPLFLPSDVVHENGHWRYARSAGEGVSIRPEPRVLQLLHAGRINDAVNIAAQRLRSSGLNPLLIGRNEGWGHDGTRLAAALLFPVSSRSLDQLFNRITRTEIPANEIEGETA